MRSLLLVAVLFGMSSAASAQQASSVMDFSQKPVAVKTLVEAIAEDSLVLYDAEVPAAQWSKPLNVAGTDTLAGKISAINTVLQEFGLEAKAASQGRILVQKKVLEETTAIGNPYPPELVRSAPSRSEGRVGGRMARDMEALNAASRAQEQLYSALTPSRNNFGTGSWNTRYGRPIWVPAWWLEQQRAFENRGNTGGLKANGDTNGVLIFSRGCFVADAQEIDGRWNQKAAILAGDYTVLTAVRIKDWRAYDLPVRPTSQAGNEVVGGRHLTIRIHKEMFENPSSYEFDSEKATSACASASR